MIEIKPQTSFNIQNSDACAPVSDYPRVERSEGLDFNQTEEATCIHQIVTPYIYTNLELKGLIPLTNQATIFPYR